MTLLGGVGEVRVGLPFAAIFYFIPWCSCKKFFIKNPLHNIYGHHTCTYPELESKNKPCLLLPLGESNLLLFQ